MFLPSEIYLIVISNLELKDLKLYRLVNRRCNILCRPKLWEKIILPRNSEELDRRIKAADEFTWKNCDSASSWEDDNTQFLRVPPAVLELKICLSDSDLIMELQAKAATQISPALCLKRFVILRPLFTYFSRYSLSNVVEKDYPDSTRYDSAAHQLFSILGSNFNTKIDILFSSDEIPQRGSVGIIDSILGLDRWPVQVRTYETVAKDRDWGSTESCCLLLPRMTNLESLKIHFSSLSQYHHKPFIRIPSSVTDINIIGPLSDRLVHADLPASAFLKTLPLRLTNLTLNVQVILNIDLDNIARLPNLIHLDLAAEHFFVYPDPVGPNVEPKPNHFKSNDLKYLRIRIEEPQFQGRYVKSIIQSSPNLEYLSLRWFIFEDISILPQFCPNLKILDLHYPHPMYLPEWKYVFSPMLRDTLPRLPKLTMVYLADKEPICVHSLSLIKAATHCPNLKALVTNQIEPDELDVPPLDEVQVEHWTRLTEKQYARNNRLPMCAVFEGVDFFVSMSLLRKRYGGIPLNDEIQDGSELASGLKSRMGLHVIIAPL